MSTYDPAKAQQDFPALGYLVNDPEISAVFREYYEGNHDQDSTNGAQWLQYKISQTNWWRTHSKTARQLVATYNNDPAEYQRQLDFQKESIRAMASRLGVNLTEDRLQAIAEKSLAENLSEFEQRYLITSGPWSTNASSPIRTQVRQAFSNYLLPYNQSLADDATGNIINQQWTIDNLNSVLAEQAKQLYPHLAAQLDSGMTMQQIVDPYRQVIARTLEMSPDSVDFQDPRWRQALDYVDDKGNHRLMTLTEAAQFARSQPEYDYTSQKLSDAASLGNTILKTFGQVA